MLRAAGAVSLALNTASATGIPFVGGAALALQEIVDACDDVKIYKKRAKLISNKCTQILNILNDQESRMEGTEMQQITDQLTPVLEKVCKRMKAFSSYNSVMTFVKRTEIGDGLDQSNLELEAAMNSFQASPSAHIALHGTQNIILQTINSHKAEMEDILYKILTEKSEQQRLFDMQKSGAHVAEQIMEAGQEELRVLREAALKEENSSSVTAIPLSVPSIRDSQRYLQYQRGLINLHRETGIPPSIKNLNGEIVRVGELAVAGGAYSDIWVGMWLAGEKVALKALRNVRASDSRAKKRFENEIKLWAEFKNTHILPFYGIVTDIGQHIHMVSPWQDNGDVLQYVKVNNHADRIRLIRGAAQGLEYLHSKNVIHGNVKCANILVTNEGEASICDFGMSKVIEEVTERSASATLTAEGGSARWLAPELIEGKSPSKEADTYSYAMAILELSTEKQPWAEYKRDATVIHGIIVLKWSPSRPQDGNITWLSDTLWDLMRRCWLRNSLLRPSMAEVASILSSM